MSKYKIVHLHKPHMVYMTSDSLGDLFASLKQYVQRGNPVIVDETGRIIAGMQTDFEWCKHKEFSV